MIELKLLRELMLIRQVNQKSAIFVISNFSNRGSNFQPNVCNRYHDLLMSMNLSDTAILEIKNADYSCIITGISKSDVTELLQIIDLTQNIKSNFHATNLLEILI